MPSSFLHHKLSRLALCLLLAPPLLGQARIEAWGWDFANSVSGAPLDSGFVQVAGEGTALRADGTLVVWGGAFHSGAPSGSDFTDIAEGKSHSLAARSTGELEAWGSDVFGQVSQAPSTSDFTRVAAGWNHSLALRSDGSLVSWGGDIGGQVTDTPSESGFVDIAAGGNHSLAMRADGSIVSWGANDYLVVSGTPSAGGFTQISSGGDHSLALRADGSIAAWGRDTSGQVSETPSGSGFVQVAAGGQHSMALSADGSIVSWGSDQSNQLTDSPGGWGFVGISAGRDNSLALRDDSSGSPFCFGSGPGANCPCAAQGGPGRGCDNTGTAGGVKLIGFGSAQLSADTFGMYVHGAPGTKPGLIFRAANQANGGFGNPVGDGLLCINGQSARSHIQLTSNGATTFADFRGHSFGSRSLGAGVPTHYQFWYRNTQNHCTGMGFNFSSAWTATWIP